MPRPASCAKKAKTPSPITTTPAEAKNNGAYFDRANDADPKESSDNTGSVPRVKKSIMSDPVTKEPLESAATCMDCVKPQGRKKVPMPSRSGANDFFSAFLKKEKRELGSVTLLCLKTPIKLRPSTIITVDASKPSMEEKI